MSVCRKSASVAGVLTLLGAAPLAMPAQVRSAGGMPLDVAGLETAGFEDYRASVGREVDGEIVAALEARVAAGYPCGTDRTGRRAHVFALPGEQARVAGR